jgi:DNA-binding transcriptional regulator GbsR (MarR family)
MIDKVVDEVNRIYKEVNEKLEKEGFAQVGMPIIKKIPMVQTQIVAFKDLAEKQLKEKLDKKIDDLASLIQKLQEGVEEGKARSIKYNLNGMRKEIDNLEQVAKELELFKGLVLCPF